MPYPILWSVNRMTKVKLGGARPTPTRKQQRYSIMKIVGSMALISCVVILLAQSDPFPGVRKAAVRHRRVNGVEVSDSPDGKPKEGGELVAGKIKEEKKKNKDDDNGGRTYVFKLSKLNDGREGEIVIETKPEWAPLGVAHLHELLDDGFYRDAKFFRVVDDFMVQFGIPAVPTKQHKTPISDDPVKETNARGRVTYAMAGKNTRTTQLFINTRKGGNAYLDKQGFAPIGVVTKGMDLVDQIYGGYGEKPNQGKIQAMGNQYLDKEFPLLSYISETYQQE